MKIKSLLAATDNTTGYIVPTTDVNELFSVIYSKMNTLNPSFDAVDFHANIAYKKQLPSLTLSGLVQSGSTCGFNDLGTMQLAETILEVYPLKVDKERCVSDWEQSALQYTFRRSQNDPDLGSVEEWIIAEMSNFIASDMETRIWQGGLGLPGFISQFSGTVNTVTATALTGITNSNLATEVDKVFAAMPDALQTVADTELRLFVSPAMGAKIKAFLRNTDNSSNINAVPTLTWGGVPIIITAGLTTNRMMLTHNRNLAFGFDGAENGANIRLDYYSRNDSILYKARWKAGTAVRVANNCVYYR